MKSASSTSLAPFAPLIAALAIAAVLSLGCKTLLAPAVDPTGQPLPERIDEPIRVPIPGASGSFAVIAPGGSVSIDVPFGAELQLESAVTIAIAELPGYSVTINPDGTAKLTSPAIVPGTPGPRPTTNADVAVDAVGGVVGAVTGNPMLGTLIVGLGHTLVGAAAALASRKKKAATA